VVKNLPSNLAILAQLLSNYFFSQLSAFSSKYRLMQVWPRMDRLMVIMTRSCLRLLNNEKRNLKLLARKLAFEAEQM
jgi:transcriptional antiterminator